MDVINLSLGEPEIEPSRDIVAQALDAAAKAGVVPVVAAGNDYDELGRRLGRLARERAPRRSPSAPSRRREAGRRSDRVVLVRRADADLAAAEARRQRARASTSSRPSRTGWERPLSGTSMASPARRRRRGAAPPAAPGLDGRADQVGARPTGDRVDTRWATSPATRAGRRAHRPPCAPTLRSLFASPDRALVRARPARHDRVERAVDLTDAGGGAGAWRGALDPQHRTQGRDDHRLRPTVDRAGPAARPDHVQRRRDAGRRPGLRRPDARHRRPPHPLLAAASRRRRCRSRRGPSTAPGIYHGNDERAASPGLHVPLSRAARRGRASPTILRGPEQVFRVRLRRPVANFGVAITRRAPGVRVEPRIVAAGDENRLTGLHRAPVRRQPVRPRTTAAPSSRRRDRADAGQLRRRLRQRQQRRRGRVHVPALARRPCPAERHAALEDGRSWEAARRRAPRRGQRSRPCLDQGHRRQPSADRSPLPERKDRDPDGGPRGRPTRASRRGGRFPGDPQHGERPRRPAEHTAGTDDLRRPHLTGEGSAGEPAGTLPPVLRPCWHPLLYCVRARRGDRRGCDADLGARSRRPPIVANRRKRYKGRHSEYDEWARPLVIAVPLGPGPSCPSALCPNGARRVPCRTVQWERSSPG